MALPLYPPPQQGLPLLEGEQPCPSSACCFLSSSAPSTLSASSETSSLFSDIFSLDMRSHENLHLCWFIRSDPLPQFCRSAILAFPSFATAPTKHVLTSRGSSSFTAHWMYLGPNLPTPPSLVPIACLFASKLLGAL